MMIDSMTEFSPKTTIIKEIDLSKDKIREPLNAYRVGVGRYGVASFSAERLYLITYGLASCKGIVLYSKESKTGLICHLSLVQDLGKVIGEVCSAFGQELSTTDAFVVNGSSQGKDSPIRNTLSHQTWPSTMEIINKLKERGVKSISFDSNKKNEGHPRGIALNLETGDLKEINNSRGWSWSNNQDTSINHRVVN